MTVTNATTEIVDAGDESLLDKDIANGKALRVLDKGYVRLTDSMGSDLTVANTARASYLKESLEFTEADARLVRFLGREGHTSPFRHAFVAFEFNAPLMVARQHWKYVVGSDHTMDAWNEASRRYVTSAPEFYVPNRTEWRSAPESSKQGSGPELCDGDGEMFTRDLMAHIDNSMALYEDALDYGVCAEQARLFLPAYGMYTIYRWSTSLAAVIHFLNQRLEHDAQLEIQLYAKAVLELVKPLFPTSLETFGVK